MVEIPAEVSLVIGSVYLPLQTPTNRPIVSGFYSLPIRAILALNFYSSEPEGCSFLFIENRHCFVDP